MAKKSDSRIWAGSRRWHRIEFKVPFFIQEMIFTVSGAKGVQRFNGSHYKYFN